MAKENAAETSATIKYSKEQLIRSDRYMKRRDLLGALLTEGKAYSLEEVENLLNNYLKGKVK